MRSAHRFLLVSIILPLFFLFYWSVPAKAACTKVTSMPNAWCQAKAGGFCTNAGSGNCGCNSTEICYDSYREKSDTCAGGVLYDLDVYCCSAGESPCGGSSSCSGKTEFTPVWLRVVEKSPTGGTIAWKPQGMAVNLADTAWSGNGLDASGNFRTYRAFSDFVRLNTGSITNSSKTFDLNRNKQGNLWIASPNILSNGINWSNHFCAIGRAAAPDAEGQLRLVSAQNTSACGPLAVDVEPRSGTCNAFAKPDVDGCGDWARGWDQNNNNIFGVDSATEGYPGNYAKYLTEILNFVDNTNNPFNWVDIRFDEYWSFSYLARGAKDCANQTTDLTFTPPTGYKCTAVGFYVHNNDNTVSYRTPVSNVTINNVNGSCYVNGPLKQNGNLILIEIQSTTPPPPPAPAPHGEINIPVNEYTKACFGSELFFDYKAYSSSSPISRNEIHVRNAAWPEANPGYIPWVYWLSGTAAPSLNRRDGAVGMLDANKKYGALNQQLFMPGNTYWFAQVAYDSQVSPQRMCSGNPISTFPSGGWDYCGNAVYASTPRLDFYGNRPWKKIRIPANVTTPVSNLTTTNGNGFVSLSWRYLNNMPEDLLGFRVWRLNRANPGLKTPINNGEIITINSTAGSFDTYFATDYGAVCDGVNNTYEVEVISGYMSPYALDNYGPVACSSVRSSIAGRCFPATPPSCSISPATSSVLYGQTASLTFNANTYNSFSSTYERDIVGVPNITLTSGTLNWPDGTIPSAAQMNSIGGYTENFTLPNLTSPTVVSMTVSDATNSAICSATIDVLKATLNIEHLDSSVSNSNASTYCGLGGTNDTNYNNASQLFALYGATATNGRYPTNPATPLNIIPANYVTPSAGIQLGYSTSTTKEIKCVRITTGTSTIDYITPGSMLMSLANTPVLPGQNVVVRVITGPVINVNAWMQARGGSVQYGQITGTFGLPVNLSTVPATYKDGASVYYFRNSVAPGPIADLGTILSFNSPINTSYFIPGAKAASTPVNLKSATFDTVSAYVNLLKSQIPSYGNPALIRNKILGNGETALYTGDSNINKQGANNIELQYINGLTDTTKGFPVLIREGDMQITHNIIKDPSATGEQKPALFYSTGSITIAPTVTNLEGIFMAAGNITIESTGLQDDVPLTIKGSLIAKGNLVLLRDSLNTASPNNVPMEYTLFNPGIYLMRNNRNFGIIVTYLNSYD